MQAIVLAGGQGSRLRAELPKVPKPLAPIHDRPFLEHLLSYWTIQGVRSFILATGFGADAIEEHLGSSWQGASISYSRESTPLGTGGAFLEASKLSKPGEPLLLLNGDSWVDLDIVRLLVFHRALQAEMTIAAFPVKEGERYGAIRREPGTSRVVSIERGARGPALISCGVFFFDARFIERLRLDAHSEPLDLERDILAPWFSACRCHAYEHDGAFIDIGTPEDFRLASEVVPAERLTIRGP